MLKAGSSLYRGCPSFMLLLQHIFGYLSSTFFCQVLYFSEKILDENLVVFRGSFPSPIEVIQRGQTPYSRQAVFWSPHPSHPYCITTWAVCQGFSKKIPDFFYYPSLTFPCEVWEPGSPLTSLVYHRWGDLSSVLGNFFILFFLHFSLDKLVGPVL